jgi:DNA end-binding protein Ku
MESTGMVAVSRLVMYGRERAVILEPRENGIVLWTLRYGNEVRDPKDYFGVTDSKTPDPKLMNLVTKLIEERSNSWNPEMAQDPVQARLLEIVASKQKSKKPPARAKAELETAPRKVISITDALRKSISSEAKSSKRR